MTQKQLTSVVFHLKTKAQLPPLNNSAEPEGQEILWCCTSDMNFLHNFTDAYPHLLPMSYV